MITKRELKNILFRDDFKHYDIVIHGFIFRVKFSAVKSVNEFRVFAIVGDNEVIVFIGDLEETHSYLYITEENNRNSYDI